MQEAEVMEKESPEAKTKAARPTIKMTQPKKKKGGCLCEEGPVLIPFSLQNMQGECCAVCMETISWHKRPIDRATGKVNPDMQLPYEIIALNEVKNKPDQIELTCRFSADQGFGVIIPSTAEKVQKAMANPKNLNGKLILLQFEKRNTEGIPTNPKMVKILSRPEMVEHIKANLY